LTGAGSSHQIAMMIAMAALFDDTVDLQCGAR
jgi:hypothetical protein